MANVIIYTKPTCPYCIAAKQLLTTKGAAFTEIIITDLSADERALLDARTNHHRTVPQIFVGEHFVGGFDNLSALDRAGKLDALLATP